MYKRDIYTVLENKKIAKDVFLMVLEGDTQYITAPGQFINILVEGFYLRRPISICDWDDKTITIIYKVVGKGTEAMAEMKAGKKLDFSKVFIKEAFANLGPSGHLKRVQPGPQGRAMPYKKSMCHLTVIVTDEKKGGR